MGKTFREKNSTTDLSINEECMLDHAENFFFYLKHPERTDYRKL
jgi:hypothetical protein